MGNVISGIFGGGQKDDSAARIAEEQARVQREAAAREQQRWEQEQARIKSDKAEAEAKAKADADKLAQQRKDAEIANAKQAEAARATGSPSFEDTRSDAAKALAAQQSGGINLPGFKTLSQIKANEAAAGGYQGQQNSLTSKTGFNNKNVGGRRYV